MDKLLESYIQFQFNRRRHKMNTIHQISVEVRFNNTVCMAMFAKHANEVVLWLDDMAIRLNEASVIGGYDTVDGNKITTNHRRMGNLMLLFSETDLRDKAVGFLQQVFSDVSRDSGASK